MQRVSRIALLLAVCSTGPGAASAAPTAGTYVLAPLRGNERGDLEIGPVSDGRAGFSLYRELGRPSTSTCCVRTASIEKATVRVDGDVATCIAPNEEGACRLVVVFSGRTADVTQLGDCGTFGVGVVASGRYRRARRRPSPA